MRKLERRSREQVAEAEPEPDDDDNAESCMAWGSPIGGGLSLWDARQGKGEKPLGTRRGASKLL